ncbi:MAG: hypothetical protein K2J32_10930, partial [Ruminococcus sp.]|nr:hypothetical protein [Ruminococcus sp.]
AYYSGGGGLCFSDLVSDDGKTFWGCKNYSYSNGMNEIVIPFDNEFTDADSKTVKATVAGDTAELQTGWWAFSEKQGDGGSDIVIDYTKVTLVYEYDNSQASGSVEGDVNKDGKFNVADLVMMQKWILGSGKLTDWKAGDLNKDEKIDIYDLVRMRQEIIKK